MSLSEPFYKTTRLDGRDIWTGQHDYAAALETGAVLRHPTSTAIDLSRPETYLSVSREIGDAIGSGAVPYRLFRVEVVGEAVQRKAPETTWYAVLALRVMEELEPSLALGPQHQELASLLARLAVFGTEDVRVLANAYRALGRPIPPDLAPEVRTGARRNAHVLLHDKVDRAVAMVFLDGDYRLEEDNPSPMPLLLLMERLKRGLLSPAELVKQLPQRLPLRSVDELDAAEVARGVVTALLFRDLLSRGKIFLLAAPWLLAFGDDDAVTRSIFPPRGAAMKATGARWPW